MRIKKLAVVPTKEWREVSFGTVGLGLGQIWQPVPVLCVSIWEDKRGRVETGEPGRRLVFRVGTR